jgi:hypothetical protein
MNLLELVREYFPLASDQEARDILWSKTAFPFDDLSGLRDGLVAAKTLTEAGKTQCDLCSSEAVEGTCNCQQCADFIRSMTNAAH